jgi:hypothetical protein
MKATNRIIINYFLRLLLEKMLDDKVAEELDSRWLKIYDKEQLKAIITWLYLDKVPANIDIENMDNQKLLETIGDEYHLLNYFIEQLAKELSAFKNPTSESVMEILTQLGQETHYLASKPLESWNAYDRSNYQGLCYKAGAAIPVYGVYDADAKEQDKYSFTLPSKLFSSSREALQHISDLVQSGQFEENELKIMAL